MKSIRMITRALLCLLGVVGLIPHVQAQNIENQIIASQYGQWRLFGTIQTGFHFSPAACQIPAGGKNFGAFSPGTPVRVFDLNTPSLSETATAGVVNITFLLCRFAGRSRA